MIPYYEQGGITIYHGDCRDVLPGLDGVLVTDPPYPNNAGHFDDAVPIAREVLAQWRGGEGLVFWSELEHPPVNLPLVAVHIWHRNNVNGRPYEPVYHFAADGVKRRSVVGAFPAVFGGAGPGTFEYLGHPTQKNCAAMRWLIQLTRTSGTIIDPFMGVGTTLDAAKLLNRRCIGIEINERYCEKAARRLQQEVMELAS